MVTIPVGQASGARKDGSGESILIALQSIMTANAYRWYGTEDKEL